MRHTLNDDFGTMVDVTAAFVPGDYSRVMGALSAEWIAEALLSTGTATVRQRRLPQEQLIWLVIWCVRGHRCRQLSVGAVDRAQRSALAQGDVTIPLTITLPLAAMPAAGWPLY
ncbi:MAG: transposase domain-containing protein [Kofleriaceae bacterium]|nr:transposase domain-containing protein [Kofleriaceae bacterium]